METSSRRSKTSASGFALGLLKGDCHSYQKVFAADAPVQGWSARQRRDQFPDHSPDWFGRREVRRDRYRRSSRHGGRKRLRPRRSLAWGKAPRGQDDGLRKIQIRTAEEGSRGAQAPEGHRGQGDQDAAYDRPSRLRREDAVDEAVLRGRRQGQSDPSLPRPRDGAPESRHGALDPDPEGDRRLCQDRAVPKARRPPDDDGAGTAVVYGAACSRQRASISGSILPPESTSPSVCPRASYAPESSAASAAAPPGSTTSFRLRAAKATASNSA